MSDSESDSSNNVFNFQNFNTTVNAKGPNTNISFRIPMRSTMHMSRNFERPRYAESAYDNRSLYYRRETSPMSIQSACDMRQRNFAGMSSRQSVFNGRGVSSMSVRSIDSSASVSAADIAFAFKNEKFNSKDWKLIKEAYQKYKKRRIRKRIERFEKRRNMRLHIKSSDDSGDQASKSSVSSDDHRSVKTYKEHMSPTSTRSTRTDLTDFRNNFRDRNMHKGNSDNISQNTLKNKFSVASSTFNNTQNMNNTVMSNQFNSMPAQRDRFRNGFLLPSQRFNRSVASSVIMEDTGRPHKNKGNDVRNNNCTSSEEEIFSTTVREKSMCNIAAQRKRSLDSDDESRLPDSKRSKLASPVKNMERAPPKKKVNQPNVDLSNSFQFAKPSLPVRKSKNKVQEKLIAKSAQPITEKPIAKSAQPITEKLIAKSAQPITEKLIAKSAQPITEKLIAKSSQLLTDFLEPMPSKIQENVQVLGTNSKEQSNENLPVDQSQDTTQNSDVSSRPSFIKRKLFTQKLDVAEKANLSSDASNSPQNNIYTLQKEKNKARKLVTNQSCLNRDIQDDNNLLDLIHKIVPADRINLSNQTSINQTKNEINNKKDNEGKWDVTSVISMCNEDDASDTYTDEEIFKADNTNKNNAKNKDVNTKIKPIEKVATKTILPQNNCKVVVKKMDVNSMQKQVVNQNFSLTHNNITKNNGKNYAKTFWDTDFESDAESPTVLPRTSSVQDNLTRANTTLDNTQQDFKKPTGYAGSEYSKKSLPAAEVQKNFNNSLMNNTTFNNTRKLNASTLSVRSHRTSKKKKGFNETCSDINTYKLDYPSNKKKDNSKEPAANTETVNSKPNHESKNPKDVCKSKNTQNEKITANVRKVSPKLNNKTKSKTEISNSVNNQKANNKITEAQNKKIATKNKTDKLNESTQVENPVKNDHKENTKRENQQNNKQTSSKSKTKAKHPSDTQSKKTKPVLEPTNLNHTVGPSQNIAGNQKQQPKNKNRPVLQPVNTNLNNTDQNISLISRRPMRSCRTRSENRSQLNNSSMDMNKSLRSRVVNLSSSIENITIKIKPKKQNKNISQMITRKSDISFSLGKQTPVAKKTSGRSRTDQRKR